MPPVESVVCVESNQVAVRDLRARAWIGRVAMLALWLAGAAVFGGAGNPSAAAVGCWTPFALLVGTSILLAVRDGGFAGAASGRSPGSVSVEDGAIVVHVRGRTHRFRVEDAVSGWTEPESKPDAETAVLQMRDGTEVRVSSVAPDAMERLLRAAGVAPDQRAVKIRVRPGASAAGRALAILMTFVSVMFALVCFGMTLAAVFGMFFEAAAPLLVLIGVLSLLGVGFGFVARSFGASLFSTVLTVGTDGVVVERRMRKRILRRAEIVDVGVVPGALVLHLEGGEDVSVPAGMDAAIALLNRMEEALQSGPRTGASLARLDRGGRPVAAWIAELRGLSRGTLGYRRAALARNELLDVVKDGAAPAERRIGAAVALSADADDEARAALRIAADTCVDPRLRVVLDGAAEMAEEELEAAVEEATAAR
jgi:hypothetical protein